jgi:Domain of unknown function (DUF4148)
MKSMFIAGSTVIFASVLFAGGPAYAQLTREQVKAELAQAIRTGDIVGDPVTLSKLNEMYPDRYPAKQAQANPPRVDAKAELAQAIRTGDIVGDPVTLSKLNEMYPDRYPPTQADPGLTRAQVKAELLKAIRTGEYPPGI